MHTETKNIELLIVNDFRQVCEGCCCVWVVCGVCLIWFVILQYQKRGSVAATGDRAKSIANFVDSVC